MKQRERSECLISQWMEAHHSEEEWSETLLPGLIGKFHLVSSPAVIALQIWSTVTETEGPWLLHGCGATAAWVCFCARYRMLCCYGDALPKEALCKILTNLDLDLRHRASGDRGILSMTRQPRYFTSAATSEPAGLTVISDNGSPEVLQEAPSTATVK